MSQVTQTVPFWQASSADILGEVLRQGARQLLSAAVEAEAEEYLGRFEHIRDASGHRQVVRNGYLPERSIASGIGPI